MNRRNFLETLVGAGVSLWVPGAKKIFISSGITLEEPMSGARLMAIHNSGVTIDMVRRYDYELALEMLKKRLMLQDYMGRYG